MVEETRHPWWDDEPVPARRTALPETKAKLPGVQEVWTLMTAVLVRASINSFLVFATWLKGHLCMPETSHMC